MNDDYEKGFIAGLLEAQKIILEKGKNEIFSVHYYSKELSTDISNLIDRINDVDQVGHNKGDE